MRPWYDVLGTTPGHWPFSLPRENKEFWAAQANGSLRSSTHLRIVLRPTMDLAEGKSRVEAVFSFLGELEAPGLIALDLDVRHPGIDPDSLLRLARAPFIPQLESLGLHSGLAPEGVRLLVNEARFEHLRRLALESPLFDEGAIRALADWSRLATLTELTLRGRPKSCDVATVVRASPHLTRIESLKLAPVHDEGVRSLLESEALLSMVRELDLANNDIGEAAQDMARSTWPRLERLIFASNLVGDEGARSLAASTGLGALTDLSLGTCRMTEVGLCAIAESHAFPELTYLNLKNNFRRSGEAYSGSSTATERKSPLAGAPLESFLRSTGFPKLEMLDMANCGVPREGRARLLGQPNLPKLRWVDVHNQDYE